jgi:hypothetical protein
MQSVAAHQARLTSASDSVDIADYLGSFAALDRGPQAFIVSCKPNYVIKPHFHQIDQFQIFHRGHATIGKHVLEPVTVHYTDGFTPYGPIIGGPEGFSFYNLRARADLGVSSMPESKDRLARRAGRSITVRGKLQSPLRDSTMALETLAGPYPDGLVVIEIAAGPGVMLLDEAVRGSGRYQIVTEGELQMGDSVLSLDSISFASAGEVLSGRQAGREGLHLFQFQLPSNA